MIKISRQLNKCTMVYVRDEDLPAFKELIHRATNLWTDAPPMIKAFSDEIIHGRVLQNYEDQATDKFDERITYHHAHQCSCGYCTVVQTKDPEPPEYSINCRNPSIEIKLPDDKPSKYMPCKKVEPFKAYRSTDQ